MSSNDLNSTMSNNGHDGMFTPNNLTKAPRVPKKAVAAGLAVIATSVGYFAYRFRETNEN